MTSVLLSHYEEFQQSTLRDHISRQKKVLRTQAQKRMEMQYPKITQAPSHQRPLLRATDGDLLWPGGTAAPSASLERQLLMVTNLPMDQQPHPTKHTKWQLKNATVYFPFYADRLNFAGVQQPSDNPRGRESCPGSL